MIEINQAIKEPNDMKMNDLHVVFSSTTPTVLAFS